VFCFDGHLDRERKRGIGSIGSIRHPFHVVDRHQHVSSGPLIILGNHLRTLRRIVSTLDCHSDCLTTLWNRVGCCSQHDLFSGTASDGHGLFSLTDQIVSVSGHLKIDVLGQIDVPGIFHRSSCRDIIRWIGSQSLDVIHRYPQRSTLVALKLERDVGIAVDRNGFLHCAFVLSNERRCRDRILSAVFDREPSALNVILFIDYLTVASDIDFAGSITSTAHFRRQDRPVHRPVHRLHLHDGA
jgi:hypothetical protein